MCHQSNVTPAPDPTAPRLRLSGDPVLPRVNTLPRSNTAPASPFAQALPAPRPPGLTPADPRWVFAVRAAAAITPSSGGVLPPERRQRLNKDAAALGLRPFDAALIIAIVQDAARTGRDPLGGHTADQLALIRPAPARRPSSADTLMLMAATVAVLLAFAVLAMR